MRKLARDLAYVLCEAAFQTWDRWGEDMPPAPINWLACRAHDAGTALYAWAGRETA